MSSLRLPGRRGISLCINLTAVCLGLGSFSTSLRYCRRARSRLPRVSLTVRTCCLGGCNGCCCCGGSCTRSLHGFLRLGRLLRGRGGNSYFSVCLYGLGVTSICLGLSDVTRSRGCLTRDRPFVITGRSQRTMCCYGAVRVNRRIGGKSVTTIAHVLGDRERRFKRSVDGLMTFGLHRVHGRCLRQCCVTGNSCHVTFRGLHESVRGGSSLRRGEVGVGTSRVVSHFARSALGLRRSLILRRGATRLGRAHSVTLTIILLVLLLYVFFIVGDVQSNGQLRRDERHMLRLGLRKTEGQVSPRFIFGMLGGGVLRTNATRTSRLVKLTQLVHDGLSLSYRPGMSLTTRVNFIGRCLTIRAPLVNSSFSFSLRVSPRISIRGACVPSVFIRVLMRGTLIRKLEN